MATRKNQPLLRCLSSTFFTLCASFSSKFFKILCQRFLNNISSTFLYFLHTEQGSEHFKHRGESVLWQ
jgi:hypothetical protein